MKRIILPAAFALLALTGCTAQNAQDHGSVTTPTWGGGWIGATEVTLPDGRTVICTYYGSALSCDWEHASRG